METKRGTAASDTPDPAPDEQPSKTGDFGLGSHEQTQGGAGKQAGDSPGRSRTPGRQD
jgi:hypothetical protein